MKYEVFTLGKHFLQVHTSKGFTLFANAKLNPNGEVVSYTDKLIRRGGTWVIDTWKFLTVKYFPENPIYCAVFGFEDDDDEVKVNATDIDVDSISGVNGQLVDIGNISLALGQSLPVNVYGGMDSTDIYLEFDNEKKCINWPEFLPQENLVGFNVIQAYGSFTGDGTFRATSGRREYIRCNFSNWKISAKLHEDSIFSSKEIIKLGLQITLSKQVFIFILTDTGEEACRIPIYPNDYGSPGTDYYVPRTGFIFITSYKGKIYRFIV